MRVPVTLEFCITSDAKATYPLQVVRSVMQQRPDGIFEQLGAAHVFNVSVQSGKSIFDRTTCLFLIQLFDHQAGSARWSSHLPLVRYTNVPRTAQLLWQSNGLPAFYRGQTAEFLVETSNHHKNNTKQPST